MFLENDARWRIPLLSLCIAGPISLYPPFVYLYAAFAGVEADRVGVFQYHELFLKLVSRLGRGYCRMLHYLSTGLRGAMLRLSHKIWFKIAKSAVRSWRLLHILLTWILILIPIEVNALTVNHLKCSSTIIF